MSGGYGGAGKGGVKGGAGGAGYMGLQGGKGATSGIYGGGGGGGGAGYGAGGHGGAGGGSLGGAGGTTGTSANPNGGNGIEASDPMSGGGGGGGAGYAGLLVTPYVDYDSFYATGGTGGNGGASTDGGGGGGGSGGAGLVVTNSRVYLYGSAVGGHGGSGGEGFSGQGHGGDGGAGIIANAAGAAIIFAGGPFSKDPNYTARGGDGGAGGGAGGAGVLLLNTTKAASFANYGSVHGGTGAASASGGVGVSFAASGSTLTNVNSISGGAGGADAGGGAGAVFLASNGMLGNRGTITGGAAGYGRGTAGAAVTMAGGTVTNSGTIQGGAGKFLFSFGLYYGAGGAGVNFTAADGTLVNSGMIKGGASGNNDGTYGSPGGAAISGAGLTVENSGSITGGTGTVQADAITFQSGKSTLALGGNSTISGAVDIQGGTLTFKQAALAGAPTDATLAAPITGAGSVVKVGTGTLTLSDAGTYKGGTTISAGALDLGAATAAGTGAIAFGTLSGTAQATLDIDSGAQTSGGTFANSLSGFNASSVLDLKGFIVTKASYAGGTLTLTGTLTNGGKTQTITENYAFTSPSSTAFTTMSDGAGGTDVMVCFTAGTRIRTARGGPLVEVAVEDLHVGDLVATASGALLPVKWLGHRTVDCRRHPRPREVMPVRIAAHAFGPNRPARDLFLSPGHSVCVDLYGEVLVPVGRLANGATIAQVEVESVTYWHVELDTHDILLAENLACESYIDCGTRAFFAESDVVDIAGLPDARVLTTDDYCRPFHPEGMLVDFARERLCLRANDLGWRLEISDPLGGLWLEVDGQRVVPRCDGLVARITLPAVVRDIRLCSDSAVPAAIHGARDERRLGLQLASLVADDGLHWRREMACTDDRLDEGFHPHEGTLRWTDGRARLPAELWAGARDLFVLRLAFAGPALPRWIASAAVVAPDARSAAA